MNTGKYIFAQLLQFINRYEFEKGVSKYNGDHGIREFNCWNQFIQLFFGQLTARKLITGYLYLPEGPSKQAISSRY